MNTLITGGAGFIGSHLAKYLVEQGQNVTIVDNLSTGRIENLDSIIDLKTCQFIEGDVCDKESMLSLSKNCDRIIHLAAAVGVKLIAEKPVQTIETNVTGTQSILNAANHYGKKVLIASSSEVYGKSQSLPFEEDADLLLGSTTVSRWSYACSKAIDEFLGLAFYREYGLEVIITRFFNTIGSGQIGQYGMVVPRFITSALNNQPLTIYGSGKQTRCFCDVGDVTKAIIGLLDTPNTFGKIYNIGSTNEISINQLANTIIKLTHSSSDKTYIPYEQAYNQPMEDMLRRLPSTKRIHDAIGWTAKTSLTDTLMKIIKDVTGK